MPKESLSPSIYVSVSSIVVRSVHTAVKLQLYRLDQGVQFAPSSRKGSPWLTELQAHLPGLSSGPEFPGLSYCKISLGSLAWQTYLGEVADPPSTCK
jgi:hypothetical protein